MSAVSTNNANLPAHLQGGKKATLGNLDQTDLIIPRVKLLHAVSPEVTEENGAKMGEYWHTVAGVSMGKELIAIPIVFRKSHVLWAPRGDDRGILARADDGVHWDNWQDADGKPKSFQVKHKKSPVIQTYTLAETVAESGLDKFGTSIAGDENSQPASALTYQMMWYFPEFGTMSPALMINTRSAVRPAKDLISKLNINPADHYGLRVKIGVKTDIADGEKFFNYSYQMDGYASEDEYNICKGLHEQFGDAKWRANDEEEETADDATKAAKPTGKTTSAKF